MPLLTKVLFVVIVLGCLAVPIGLAHMQHLRSQRQIKPIKLTPARLRHMWIVDNPNPYDDDAA